MKNCGITASELDQKTKAEWDKCAEFYQAFAELNRDYLRKGKVVSLSDDLFTYHRVKKYLK